MRRLKTENFDPSGPQTQDILILNKEATTFNLELNYLIIRCCYLLSSKVLFSTIDSAFLLEMTATAHLHSTSRNRMSAQKYLSKVGGDR